MHFKCIFLQIRFFAKHTLQPINNCRTWMNIMNLNIYNIRAVLALRAVTARTDESQHACPL